MTIKASIFWKGDGGVVVELDFAYPLAVGSTFVLRTADDTLVCTVGTIVHYPVNTGSGNTPSVAYYVEATPVAKMKKRWWQAKEALLELIKPK